MPRIAWWWLFAAAAASSLAAAAAAQKAGSGGGGRQEEEEGGYRTGLYVDNGEKKYYQKAKIATSPSCKKFSYCL